MRKGGTRSETNKKTLMLRGNTTECNKTTSMHMVQLEKKLPDLKLDTMTKSGNGFLQCNFKVAQRLLYDC